MAELGPYQWDLDGLALGDGTPYAVLDTQGLEDGAEVEHQSSQNWGDGQTPGTTRLTDRLVVLTIGFYDETTEAQKDALRAKASPKANRLQAGTLRWRHRPGGEGDDDDSLTRRVNFRPAGGTAVRIPGNYEHLVHGHADGVQIRLQVDDPVIYSDAVETVNITDPATPGDATEFEVDNKGSLAAVNGAPPGSTLGVYQFEIVAGAGGCTWPFIRNVTDGVTTDSEMWIVKDDIGPDGVVSASWERVSRRNVTPIYAEVQGGLGSPVPGWPILRPGVNTLEIGCTVGSVTGTFEYRSTW